MEKSGRTLLAKIWDQHVIARLSEDTDLLHVDRHLLHDLGGSRGLLDLKSRNLSVHNPELTFATPDHAISTAHGRAGTIKIGQELLAALRVETSAAGIQLFDVDQPGQGIVHVIGPELGLSLPGSLIVCGDSHTCTHGGLGALAFGIGSSELTHVLATQALIQRRPKTMRVRFEGKLPLGVTAKDMILALDRPCRCRRRHRICRRICRQRDRRSAGRRAAHHLQSFDRAWRQDGYGCARTRKPMRTSGDGATPRKAGCGSRRSGHWRELPERPRCGVRQGSSHRCRRTLFRR